MKKLKILITICLTGLFLTSVQAQKISVKSGDLGFLQEVTELNAEYDYSQMVVGKFKTEQAYIDKKKQERDEKEPGTGDLWEAEWHDDKEKTYHVKFEELFNIIMYGKNQEIRTGSFPNADHTVIVRTTFLEPGFNIGISRKDASINVEFVFVETDNPENILAVITMDKVPGRGAMGGDFDTEYRIGEAYAKAGKELAGYIWKSVLK